MVKFKSFVVRLLTVSMPAVALFSQAAADTEPGPVDPPARAMSEPILYAPSDALISPGPLADLLQPYRDFKEQLYQDHNVAINAYYTLVYQGASDVLAKPDQLVNGRLDLGAIWHAYQIEDVGHGHFEFLLRSGVPAIGKPRSTSLSNNVGSIMGVNNTADPDEISINILSWTQGLFNNQVAVTLGKIHPNQYIDLSPVANDESSQFIGGPFDGTQTLPNLGNYTGGAVLAIHPDKQPYYFTAVVSDLLGTQTTGLGTLDEGKFSTLAEFGLLPTFSDSLKGHFRFIGAYANTRDRSGSGMGLSFDLTFNNALIPFIRYGRNFDPITPIREQVSAGVGIIKPFGRKDDMFGVGFAWSDPQQRTLREETLVEVFYRVQVTDTLQLTPDIQFVINPSAQTDTDLVTVWTLRLKATF